jgi:hypothetical protein
MELTQANQAYSEEQGFFRRLSIVDWLYAALVAGSLYAFGRFGAYMDYYEKAVLLLAAPTFAWLGWHWKPVRLLMVVIAVLSLGAIAMYGGALELADKFFLKYMLSSQSAILWMSALFCLSTLFYWGGLATTAGTGNAIGSRLCWAAVVLGFRHDGALVRVLPDRAGRGPHPHFQPV